jgi:hypothetical protein
MSTPETPKCSHKKDLKLVKKKLAAKITRKKQVWNVLLKS